MDNLKLLWQRFLELEPAQRQNLSLSPRPLLSSVPSREKCLRHHPAREWNHTNQDRDGRTVAVMCLMTNECEACRRYARDY